MENNKLHILIVDDDDRIRDLLKDYLINNNYIISTAGNAEEAKEKLKYIKFDILILDPNKASIAVLPIRINTFGSIIDMCSLKNSEYLFISANSGFLLFGGL